MSVSKELLLSILSMDAYNQGYGANVEHGKVQIGSATIYQDSSVLVDEDGVAIHEDAGFYAVSYTVVAGAWEGLNDSTTVISYRGTDDPRSDFWGGWKTGLGFLTSQVKMAENYN